MNVPPPWSGVVPPEDLATFERAFAGVSRPMTAGSRPALLVVDMMLSFVDSAYPTGHSATGWPAVAANVTLLEAARAAGLPVFFSDMFADPAHVAEPGEQGRWKTSAAAPDRALPPGNRIVDELAPRPGEIVIHKGYKPSAFFGTPLASYLVHTGADTVVVAGMSTSGCVRATALDAFQNGFDVVIPFEATADRCQISHKINLFDLHMKYVDVVGLDEAIAYIDSTVAVAGVR